MDIVWTPETVSKLFEIGPNAYTPGTKMPEQRIGSPEDRAALMRFLEKTTKNSARAASAFALLHPLALLALAQIVLGRAHGRARRRAVGIEVLPR